MSSPQGQPAARVLLIFGEDDFTVKQRARAVFGQWCGELGGLDHEIVDAAASNVSEATTAIRRLREALQTLPFLGSGKVVWFKDCRFLGEERVGSSAAVSEGVTALAKDLADLVSPTAWLLVSAGKADKRKAFYKAFDRMKAVEYYPGLSLEDRDWFARASEQVLQQSRSLGQRISAEAVSALVNAVGPNVRLLRSELEKASLYAGAGKPIDETDVEHIVVRSRQSRAFAVGEALGDRDVPRLLRCLDEELHEVQTGSQKSEIGLLYGLISKVRALIIAKELQQANALRPERDYVRFKGQFDRLPDTLRPDREGMPGGGINPYVLFKAMSQAANYSSAELVRAMGVLLECNRRLVSTSADEALVLQQALLRVTQPAGAPVGAPPAARRSTSGRRPGAPLSS